MADDKDRPVGARIAAGLLMDAINAEPRVRLKAVGQVLDRAEGRPAQTHRVETEATGHTAEDLIEMIRKQVGYINDPPAK